MPDKRPVNEPVALPFFGSDPAAPPVRRPIEFAPGEPTPMPFFGPGPMKRDLGGEPVGLPFFGGLGKVERKPGRFPGDPVGMPFFGPPIPKANPRRGGNPWLELFVRSLFGY